jgi:preprotein translocase subunit SecY
LRDISTTLATFQALGIAIAIEGQQAAGGPVVLIPGIGFKITTVATLVTGTMFLVWLGEQISERGIGNGISLIIFGSIVAGLPSAVAGTLELARTGTFSPIGVLALFIGAIAITAAVVFVEKGQRRITVNYAKRQQGRRMLAGQTSHLPLKLNMAGVIPPIFASSIILFPASLGSWFGQAEGMGWLRDISTTLATFQALGIAIAIEGQQAAGGPVVLIPGIGFKITTVATLVTGTMFLVWLGEQISERGIGNGISLIIFGSIVAGLPSAVACTLELARTGTFSPIGVLALFIGAIAITAAVVFVEKGQRRITVNYAKRQQGRRMLAGQTSHLPLKLNMAGVIPPIFASSIILFPASLGSWFGQAEGMGWLRDISTTLATGQPIYALVYAAMIVFFCFFYTALVFNPNEIADNLKKSGAFVPGIRPGVQTTVRYAAPARVKRDTTLSI